MRLIDAGTRHLQGALHSPEGGSAVVLVVVPEFLLPLSSPAQHPVYSGPDPCMYIVALCMKI